MSPVILFGSFPEKYGLFCKIRPPVSFVMIKFQKQNLVKIPFYFVSQQKTRRSEVVFDGVSVKGSL